MEYNFMDRLESLEKRLPPPEPPKLKKPLIPKLKIKKSLQRQALKKPLCLVYTNNKTLEVKQGEWKDGNIKVGNISYEFDPSAVYIFNKKTPIISLIQWRLLPVGGAVEEYKFGVLGGEDDKKLTEKFQLNTRGQQTIIREIQQAQVEGDTSKKKPPLILWLLVGAAVLYIISKVFGG